MIVPKKVKLEQINCPLKCYPNDKLIFRASDIVYKNKGQFNIVKCNTCGLLRQNPRPTQKTISYYYNRTYTPYLSTVIKNKKRDNAGSFRKKIFRPLVRKVFNFNYNKIPNIKPGNMLEIGCASGSYLKKMSDKGWNVRGIEFSKQATKNSRNLGFNVHCGSVETLPKSNVRFDLIVGWMVLEHLHKFTDCLRHLKKFSKNSTYLVFSVPNAGSFEFRLFKQYCYHTQVPYHLYFFDPKTLSKLLSTSGWRIEKIYHQRLLQDVIASLGYFLKFSGYNNFISKFLIEFPDKAGRWQYLIYPVAWLLSFFGNTGRMTVWARPVKK